jgi:hypothetical protein
LVIEASIFFSTYGFIIEILKKNRSLISHTNYNKRKTIKRMRITKAQLKNSCTRSIGKKIDMLCTIEKGSYYQKQT